jgi:hypothetical protein
MAGRHLAQLRLLVGALLHGERAAGMEAASGGRIDRGGNLARQDYLLAIDVKMGREGG